MSALLWKTGTSNAISSTLNGDIGASDDSITLTSVSGLVAPGVITIDRVDSNGTATPVVREYITFTGISTSTLTGCTRGVAGSTEQSHSSGAVTEENFSTTHWGDLMDYLLVSHTTTGTILTSNATVTATLDAAHTVVSTHLNANGASVTGNFPIHPNWVVGGFVSLATTSVGSTLPMPQGGSWQFFSASLNNTASGPSSLVLDINKNGTSIMGGTQLVIAVGDSYACTASINTKLFNSGDTFTLDIDNPTWSSDLIVVGRG